MTTTDILLVSYPYNGDDDCVGKSRPRTLDAARLAATDILDNDCDIAYCTISYYVDGIHTSEEIHRPRQ